MPTFEPVDHDPFAQEGPQFEPVDHDPFAEQSKSRGVLANLKSALAQGTQNTLQGIENTVDAVRGKSDSFGGLPDYFAPDKAYESSTKTLFDPNANWRDRAVSIPMSLVESIPGFVTTAAPFLVPGGALARLGASAASSLAQTYGNNAYQAAQTRTGNQEITPADIEGSDAAKALGASGIDALLNYAGGIATKGAGLGGIGGSIVNNLTAGLANAGQNAASEAARQAIVSGSVDPDAVAASGILGGVGGSAGNLIRAAARRANAIRNPTIPDAPGKFGPTPDTIAKSVYEGDTGGTNATTNRSGSSGTSNRRFGRNLENLAREASYFHSLTGVDPWTGFLARRALDIWQKSVRPNLPGTSDTPGPEPEIKRDLSYSKFKAHRYEDGQLRHLDKSLFTGDTTSGTSAKDAGARAARRAKAQQQSTNQSQPTQPQTIKVDHGGLSTEFDASVPKNKYAYVNRVKRNFELRNSLASSLKSIVPNELHGDVDTLIKTVSQDGVGSKQARIHINQFKRKAKLDPGQLTEIDSILGDLESLNTK